MRHATGIILACALFVPAAALAKGGANNGFENVIARKCSADVQSYCSSMSREGELVKCLARNQSRISHGCLVSMTKTACKQHMKKGTVSPFPCD